MTKFKLIILTAPSGSGKTTIAKYLLKHCKYPLTFSISATTRKPRENEEDGKDYYFLSLDEFEKNIKQNAFIEYEEVYESIYYGTYRQELDRIWSQGSHALLDMDIEGATRLKSLYGNQSTIIYIYTKCLEEARIRLQERGTENQKNLDLRLRKASYETTIADELIKKNIISKKVLNFDLNRAQRKTLEYVENFLNPKRDLGELRSGYFE